MNKNVTKVLFDFNPIHIIYKYDSYALDALRELLNQIPFGNGNVLPKTLRFYFFRRKKVKEK